MGGTSDSDYTRTNQDTAEQPLHQELQAKGAVPVDEQPSEPVMYHFKWKSNDRGEIGLV